MTTTQHKPITYWDYIRVPELLELQTGVDGDESLLSQDEVMFITIHQVDELWLKLILRDVVAARNLFAQSHVPDDALAGASRVLNRIRIILELATDHFRLMETLTPRDYLEFRDKLFPANGGQSPQYREIEILLGLPESERIPYVTGGSYLDVLKEPDGSDSWALSRVKARQADKPTFKEVVEEWLFRTPINGSGSSGDGDTEVVNSFIEDYLESHKASLEELAESQAALANSAEEEAVLRERYAAETKSAATFLRAEDVPVDDRARRRRIRAAVLYIESYRELPLLAWPREILDGIVAVEQAYVTFRQRHARMAERIIGRRVGTGGSTGVDYLDAGAIRYRIFTDLWAARTLLIRRDRLSDPPDPDFYRFQYELS